MSNIVIPYSTRADLRACTNHSGRLNKKVFFSKNSEKETKREKIKETRPNIKTNIHFQ